MKTCCAKSNSVVGRRVGSESVGEKWADPIPFGNCGVAFDRDFPLPGVEALDKRRRLRVLHVPLALLVGEGIE